MTDRPYVLLSCAVSLDGYLDDARPGRLVLSSQEDLARVDEVRAGCDAILVGAATLRQDDPRLLVRSPHLRAARAARGLPASPARATVTGSGDLDPAARFFTVGDTQRVVYCSTSALTDTRERLADTATDVVDAAEPIDLAWVLGDLGRRGLGRVMVEGGRTILTRLLSAGLADELHLAVAPVLVGDSRATRFLGDGAFPWRGGRRASLVDVGAYGDTAVLRYALSDRFADAE